MTGLYFVHWQTTVINGHNSAGSFTLSHPVPSTPEQADALLNAALNQANVMRDHYARHASGQTLITQLSKLN